MAEPRSHRSRAGTGTALLGLMRAIAAGKRQPVLAALAASPDLVREREAAGASRKSAEDYLLTPILHYVYAGDTLLHIAAAAFDARLVERLVELGADVRAKNRRGAEPLHYATDANHEDDGAQGATVRSLCRLGAEPNALDKSGVAPLHRAVRTRAVAAVEALIAAGADPRARNESGSTPLHLAVQNTGRGGTGTASVIERQRQIILLLLERGANAGDKDANRRTAAQAAQAEWIRELIEARSR